jgi:uncharacterized protein with HEPN domain
MRSDAERLRDILHAIGQIEKYVAAGEKAFREDEMLQVWFVHHIQIIGEASAKISPEFKEKHKSIPWQDIVDMRNILVHQYFGVDLSEIWDTIQIDIPEVKREISKVLGEIDHA